MTLGISYENKNWDDVYSDPQSWLMRLMDYDYVFFYVTMFAWVGYLHRLVPQFGIA